MRDFRGAKVMARALRDALKTKAIESTHTEALEPTAKAFGYKNWNILSAKIEAAERTLSDERSLSASSAAAPTESQQVRETALRPSGGNAAQVPRHHHSPRAANASWHSRSANALGLHQRPIHRRRPILSGLAIAPSGGHDNLGEKLTADAVPEFKLTGSAANAERGWDLTAQGVRSSASTMRE